MNGSLQEDSFSRISYMCHLSLVIFLKTFIHLLG